MFVPQVTPLDGGQVGVAEVERGPAPAAVRPERSQQWIVPPEGIADNRGYRQVRRGIQDVGKQSLTWEQTAPGVDRLAGIVEGHLGGTGRELTRLKNTTTLISTPNCTLLKMLP